MLRTACLLLAAAAAALAGCGSGSVDDLPPAAEPEISPRPDMRPAGYEIPLGPSAAGVLAQPGHLATLGRDSQIAIVSGRERVVELYDARTLERIRSADAGVGPTNLATDGVELLYVVDTQGDALLVFHTKPELELIRRVNLPGSPYGIAIDRTRRRIWVTLTGRNRLVELSAGSRPRPLRELATVRQPDAVAVNEETGHVFVTGRTGGVLQVIERP